MAVFTRYHDTLQKLLSANPAQGTAHTWIFRVALHMRWYHTSEATVKFLRAHVNNPMWVGRRPTDEEIGKAVRKAYSATAEESTDMVRIDWPPMSADAVLRVLTETEPVTLTPTGVTAAEAIAALWKPDDLVCAGIDNRTAQTVTRQELLSTCDPAQLQFVVPSPMSARRGETRDGHASSRCLANSGPRRHLVVESDALTKPDQAKVLAHIAKVVPMVMVVDSGGKSLHGWFDVRELQELAQAVVFAWACRLGADPHTWTRCQWVRMPGGTRYDVNGLPGPKGGQAVLYYRGGNT